MFSRIAAWALIAVALPLQAQVRATTGDGRVVVLAADGTWSYVVSASVPETQVATRPTTALANLDLWRGRGVVYYDATKWHVTKLAGDSSEYYLHNGRDDAYVSLTTTRFPLGMDVFRQVTLKTLRVTAPDARVTAVRKWTINGLDVTEEEIRATVDSVPFVYLICYYTGDAGTMQMFAFTTANLFNEYRSDFQEFMNGFVRR